MSIKSEAQLFYMQDIYNLNFIGSFKYIMFYTKKMKNKDHTSMMCLKGNSKHG